MVWQQNLILRGNKVISNPLEFFNVAFKLSKKKKVLWLLLNETRKTGFYTLPETTCIATALNSPFTRDERLTTHRLMPVENMACHCKHHLNSITMQT